MTKRKANSQKSTISSQNSESIRRICQEIRQGKSFLVTTHENPDGDGLGSALALAAGLKKLKKKVKLYNADRLPESLKFLPFSDRFSQTLGPQERFDATFIVDCADLERIGEIFSKHPGLGKKIVLDHHLRSGRAGDINWVNAKAASTGVIVYDLLKRLRTPITKEIATNIYCTLVTDTGNFRYSNTDASVLGLARELVEKGVEPWKICQNLYDRYPIERLKLMAKVLATLEVAGDGKIASLHLTQEMLRETGATSDLAEEFINLPRSIDSVEVAAFFREVEKGVKVSFRSKNVVDVAELASRFGGGGHARAAGCKIDMTLREAKEKVLEVLRISLS